jgi:hypothetical protein
MVDFGKRKCKVCSEVFNKRSPLDMFCSSKCAFSYDKKPSKSLQPIKQFSNKRAKRNQAYLKAKEIFMMESGNQTCIVMATLHNKTVPATEIHHTNGRENERLTDRMYWLAVSREGHQWIHANPQLAKEQGWLTKDYQDEIL